MSEVEERIISALVTTGEPPERARLLAHTSMTAIKNHTPRSRVKLTEKEIREKAHAYYVSRRPTNVRSEEQTYNENRNMVERIQEIRGTGKTIKEAAAVIGIPYKKAKGILHRYR